MTAEKIKEIIRCGETSTVQFKKLFKTAEDVANELVAFSNSNGGQIFIGVDDKTGEILGLDYDQLREIGSLVASAADDRVRPAVFPQVETEPVDGKAVMIVTVKKGPDAPYTKLIRRVKSM
ncbi:ATP-binding protein [Muribaculum sp.]|uniref:AlbA family DNA-binding domain-containing protein n=1 Tax=Muribaculum sp. TaxID=1918611 RepID=UPI00257CE12D|nr:ATP-binding protein [Muribaculum sp.]